MRWWVPALLALALVAGCAPRARFALLPQAAMVGDVRPVFLATTRAVEADGSFGAGRSPALSFARFDVSIPPDRAPGTLPTPRGAPDARREIVAADAARIAGARAFRDAVAMALAERPPGGREVTLYVHGYNSTLAEGVFRTAQLSHDLDLPGVAVHYAWPSAARALWYVHDRDAALFARDGLEETLALLADTGAERVTVVAHSLGAMLAMDTLRQVAIAGGAQPDGVVLISPDLDVALFRSQAERIGPLPRPFAIFVSGRDRALRLASRITGRGARLGAVRDPAEIADLDVTVIDVTAFEGGGAEHFVAGDSPALLSMLAEMRTVAASFGRAESAPTGLVPGAVLMVRGATRVVLDPEAR